MLVQAVDRRKLILRARGTITRVCFGFLPLSSLHMAALVSLDSCIMGQPLSDTVVCAQSSRQIATYASFSRSL